MNLERVTFHNNVSGIGTGVEYTINGNANSLMLQFITSGTFTAKVEAQLTDTNTWYTYPCIQLPAMTFITDTFTDKTTLYQVDLSSGISKVRVNLTAVSGAITVYGRVVG